MSKEARETLLAQIKAVMATQENPGDFLRSLQDDLEDIPGAWVSFSTRNIEDAWLHEEFDALELEDPEDRQAILVRARGTVDDENTSYSDDISNAIWEQIELIDVNEPDEGAVL